MNEVGFCVSKENIKQHRGLFYKNKLIETDKISFGSDKLSLTSLILLPSPSENDHKSIKREDVNKISDKFLKLLLITAHTGRLKQDEVQFLINTFAEGLPIEVRDSKENCRLDSSTEACCFPKFNAEGKLEKAYLFINFDKLAAKIVKSITHEFTHALQFSTEEASQMMKKLHASETPLDNYFKAYTEFETNIIKLNIHETIDNNADTISKMLKIVGDKLKDPLSVFNFTSNQRKKQYDEFLNQALEKFDIKDKKLAIEYFKFRIDLETEAYSQGSKALKKSACVKDKCISYDLIPKMFKDLSLYFEKLLTEV